MENNQTKTDMRLEKLENHYESLKRGNERIEHKVDGISGAILGNDFGEIGLVKRFKEYTIKTEELEKEIEKTKIYIRQASWLFGIIAASIIVILTKFLFKGI